MFENWKMLVVGAGTMGHSIAQVFATNGFPTTLVDQSAEQLDSAKKMIANNLSTLRSVGEITPEQEARGNSLVTFSTSLDEAARGANLVVETIYENPAVKQELYSKLDSLCSQETIITSNTSALNIFDIAKISHPERLIIAHWFNPPHVMPLVEVVKGPDTSEETVVAVKTLLEKLGKTPAVINQYIPGFIINRMTMVILREAGYMISQGWTTAEDIDNAIVKTFGPRFTFEGPNELGDHVGWDVALAVSSFVFPQLCNDASPSPMVKDFCAKGELGVKSGKGFKDYSGRKMQEIQSERNMKILKMLRAIRSELG